jgi:hypothetical protein
MVVPVPTSGKDIGPGSFPAAHRDSIEIKNPDRPSHFVLRGRKPHIRDPLPDQEVGYKAFSETHTKGPTFDKHIIGGGNVVMQAMVKTKITQIYPRLAEQKFTEPAAPALEESASFKSVWGRKKIK